MRRPRSYRGRKRRRSTPPLSKRIALEFARALFFAILGPVPQAPPPPRKALPPPKRGKRIPLPPINGHAVTLETVPDAQS